MLDKYSAVELYLSHYVFCSVLSVILDSFLVGRAHCDRDVTKEARFSHTHVPILGTVFPISRHE